LVYYKIGELTVKILNVLLLGKLNLVNILAIAIVRVPSVQSILLFGQLEDDG
jgi:hypothetical protein